MRTSFTLLALLLTGSAVAAADPVELPFTMISSGYLLDNADRPVDQLGLQLRVQLFTLSSKVADEVAEWDSGECIVDVQHGYYIVALGKDCGSGLVPSKLPTDEKRYLEVTIGGITLAPRQLVGTIPTAATATNALKLAGKSRAEIDAEYDSRYVRTQVLGAGASAQSGDLFLAGTVKAAAFSGALDAANITGSIPDTLLASNGTFAKLGADNLFVGLNDFQGDTSAKNLLVSGAASFAVAPSLGPATGAPFTVGSEAKVEKLNADLLDGLNSLDFMLNAGNAGGDLSGTNAAPVVAKLQGSAVAATAPTSGQHLVWGGSAWAPAAAVASFNDRTGAVMPAANDYTFAQLGGTVANAQLAGPLVASVTAGPGLTVTNPTGVDAATVALNLGNANTWTGAQTFDGIVKTPGLEVASKAFGAGASAQTFPLFYLQWDQSNWGNNMVIIEIFYSSWAAGGYWKGMAQVTYGGEPTLTELEATGTYNAPTIATSTLVSSFCGNSSQGCNKSALVQLPLTAYYSQTVRLTTADGFTTGTVYAPRIAW